jgi:HK97 family phage major capsid protein
MKTNLVELTLLVQEASELANKATLTKTEERKLQFLTGTAIPAVKAGATLQEVQEAELNAVEDRNGLRRTTLGNSTPRETRAKAAFMRKLFTMENNQGTREMRASNEAEGAILSQLGTYTSLGSFVPTDFAGKVFATMAQHDPLYDEDSCTLINSTNARPFPIPVYDDLSNEAVQVSEAQNLAQGAQVNLGNPGHVVLGSYSFRSPIHYMSLEVFQDAGDQAMGNAYDLFAQFAGDRLARAVGQKLVIGGGPAGTTITGIIPALQAAGVNGTVATGSSGNTGGAETGLNSIGSVDIANLYFSVNAAYRNSPKCAFMMADSTLQFLAKIVTKQGLPLVNFEDGIARIMGKPVKVSPSVPAIGSDAITVLFGDFSYWNTRLVSDDSSRIQVFKETRVEQGLVGLQYFLRADGILAFNSPNAANAPINYLIQHS